MNLFTLALAGFVLIHIGVSASGLRGRIIGAIGLWPYRALFSLASLALLLAMIHGFGLMRADPFNSLNEQLWNPPDWLRWPGLALTGLGVALAAAGALTPGPTFAGFEKTTGAEAAKGVLRITRHPFLWGVALWAGGHALMNGERFALMLFGALGLMVIFGARSIDRKGRARDREAWDRFAEVTSNVPFAAITQGRNHLAVGELGWRALLALAAVVIIAWAHQSLIGVSAFSNAP